MGRAYIIVPLFLLVGTTVESFSVTRAPDLVPDTALSYSCRLCDRKRFPSAAHIPLQSATVPVETEDGAAIGASLVNGDTVVTGATSMAANEALMTEKDAFSVVAGRAAICLFESDVTSDAVGSNTAQSTAKNLSTNWIHDATAFVLRQALDKMKLKLADERTGQDRDEASAWIRWMKSTPTPLIVDLSEDLRTIANATISDYSHLDCIDQTRNQFLARLNSRIILLPSGAELVSPLSEPPASIICGKLLFGGISRYRLLASTSNSRTSPRKMGERTDVKSTNQDDVPVWMQYGGPDRMYEALDMGPAAVLEIVLMPRGGKIVFSALGDNMVVGRIAWKPCKMFDFVPDDEPRPNRSTASADDMDNGLIHGYSPVSLAGKKRNDAFESDFRSAVGGLRPQIDAIVRRVLDGRIIRPAEDFSIGDDPTIGDTTTAQLALASMEAEELALLGLTPVRGLLLYGPPGCGKTALAREISRALRARAPKIVTAPELLDRWVGGSEKLVRALFADAEAELAACNEDASKSALHVIVIDEIDAVFRKRSSAEDSGEATRSSVVNQILAKLDGVHAIPNVLFIGMTNRRELLDEALLRPGRLEVQIEIPLPDKQGRREILQIHFEALRNKGRLSKPLCCAIDGIPTKLGEYDQTSKVSLSVDVVGVDDDLAGRKGGKRRAVKRAFDKVVDSFPAVTRRTFDLAADYATGGFSGADIAGLVRCAGSIALARARTDGNGVEGILITLEDVKAALIEVKG